MSQPTVLVVDDSPLIRQVVADAFAPHGYRILAAADGSEALRKIAESHPDLIVADILMPVMDGWRLCAEVRRAPETSGIPFIFLTTEQEVSKRVRGLGLGADDYLTKPFSAEELVARAARLLERTRRIRDAAASFDDKLAGHTRHVSMADLLQILSLNGRTGTLSLERDDGRAGRIYFREGRIIHAATEGIQGEKALFRLMMWPESRFVFEGLPEDVTATIRGATSAVLMDGFTHWDELRHLGERIPPPEAQYQVRPRVAAFIDQVDLGAVERAVLSAVRDGLTAAEILDALPQRDLDIYRALLWMVEKGFLERVGEEADTQPLPRSGSAE
jgi:DNA-binding response OmpR family regulator